MKKVLIVGCGGSGAVTLAYMMDQLKTMLAERLPERYSSPRDVKLPTAWQFVSVDVPVAAEKAGKNLPNVQEAGGRYVSVGSSARYASVDSTVSNSLASKGALGSIASWAIADPNQETTPISAGAGQYRGIGRMLMLSKLSTVQQELQSAWQILFNAETDRELAELNAQLSGSNIHDADQSKGTPLVFVISSMAGGAGASMAIDVCRLLVSLNGNSVSLNSLFMVTPDIFGKIDEDKVAGANPNALAMFGELVASQLGAAAESDREIFEALGVRLNDESIPVGRVFPVGVRSGVEGKELGDGEARTVYRALGRGLAALMVDPRAMETYEAHTLGNRGGLAGDRSLYGWGVPDTEEKNIPWGSYGYAQLSMGRDRYAEYAAQRLARQAVHKLLEGHIDPREEAAGDVQIKRLMDNNEPLYFGELGKFMPTPQDTDRWLLSYFSRAIDTWVREQQESLRRQLPPAQNMRGKEWADHLHQTMSAFNQQLQQANTTGLYSAVNQWALPENVQEGFLRVIRAEIARYGAPYGAAVVERILQGLREVVIPRLRTLTAPATVTVPETISRLGKSRISDTTPLVQEIMTSTQQSLRFIAGSHIARLLVQVLEDFAPNFVEPLLRVMREQQRELERTAELQQDSSLGIAQLKTDVPNLWPEESDLVPNRFDQAANEVFLTEVREFPGQFQSDLIRSVSGDSFQPDYNTALHLSAQKVIDGEWESLAGAEQAPANLLTLVEPWVAKVLVRDPESGVLREPHQGRFEFNIGSGAVLSRSRGYIYRRGFSFHEFISQSLRDYVMSPALTESERMDRRRHLISKFELTMRNALPLAQVNKELVDRLYGREVSYNFNFSTIPFEGDVLADELQQSVSRFPNLSTMDSNRPLENYLANQGEERSIDVFGSYPNYAPVVFSNLLPPIRNQWQRTPGNRSSFWQSRRARPLPAALPMHPAERRAMIGGWYVGWITGRLVFPWGDKLDVSDTAEQIQVFDSTQHRWLSFEAPLLTPPSRMRSPLDWLPTVLESSTLAWTAIQEAPLFESVRPYAELRKLFDSGDTPTTGARTLEAQRLLNAWIYTGQRQTEHNAIFQEDANTTPEERRDQAVAFLEKHRNFTQAYVPSRVLYSGSTLAGQQEREFADVRDRSIAARLPFYADLAPDINDILGQLIDLVQQAYADGDPSQRAAVTPDPLIGGGGPSAMPGEGLF